MATFTNQATLTYNGGTVNSNIVTGELVQVLTASKTAAAESYRTGDLVTYVVQLRSTGAAALTGLIFLPLAAARRLRALMSAVLILLMAETLAAVLCGVGLAAAESCLMAAAQSCACVLAGQPLFFQM